MTPTSLSRDTARAHCQFCHYNGPWTSRWPLSARGPGHVTQYRNFVTPVITGKTSEVNYRYINNNKTANLKDKKT